jgi:hypothetical protein
MNKLPRKSGLLFGMVLAACAFMAPMASAASWSVVGTTHQLIADDLAFTQSIGGGLSIGATCTTSQFDVDVTSAAVVTFTGGRFDNCRGTGLAAGCTVTATGTRFPWTMTAATTTNIQIHSIHVDWRFETAPGGGACNALTHGLDVTVTGTLTGGVWDPSALGVNRRATFTHTDGLVSHSLLANGAPIFWSARFRDPAGTLNLLD